MTNETYTDFPFIYNGVNFISRINFDSPFLGRLKALPLDVLQQFHCEMLSEYLPAQTYTLQEIQDVLNKLNDGGSHAFILLGENNVAN